MAFVIPHLLLLLMPSLIHAQSNGRINIGSFIIAGDVSTSPWLSPSNDFAFGFREVDNRLFLLSIWYNKLPEKTVVWFAKYDQNPTPKGSKVELTASDGLVLHNSQSGTSKLISPVSGTVSFAMMNDTGNFMLVDSNSKLLWESFKQPTNTLLPTQKMEISDFLSSYKLPHSYSLGKFQFQLFKGNAVLNIRNLPTTYTYEPYKTVARASDGYQIVFDKDGFLYMMQRDGNRVNISEPEGAYPIDTHYYKLTLNFDGVLTVSYYPKNPTTSNESWRDFWKMPENICMAMVGELSSGICGYNSICTLNNDQRPSCKCPPGYSFMDLNDTFSNCKPNIPQACEEGTQNSTNDLYTLQDLPNTDWPMLDYELYSPFTAEECKKVCMLDCLCVVAVYRDSNCWKKKLPLSNGREDSKERSVSYLKLRRNNGSTGKSQDDLSMLEGKKNQETVILVISALLGCCLFVILMLASMICWGFIFYNKKKLAKTGNFLESESFESKNLCQFTYKELREATDGFKEELGRGSCGIVYKGEIKTDFIAVKKLDKVFEDNEKEFRTEVNVIGKTHHKNLVRLLGYCDEHKNRILIYEYMRNGTLANLLFGERKPSWNLRAQIAYGIARGLVYLHEECDTQIIHCDIKPQNVLLDEHFNAKISDFGLAKLLKMDESRTETGIRGTKGYVAPDWFRSAPVTAKVDVYSFGVLLLEIICCRRNGDMEDFERRKELLVDWAYDCFQQGRLDVLIEEDLEAMDDLKRLERFVMVAIWCLQEDPSQRPTMKKVIWMIEGIVPVSIPPNPCPFSSICS